MKFLNLKYLFLSFFVIATLFSCVEEPLEEDSIDVEQNTEVNPPLETEKEETVQNTTDKNNTPEKPKISSESPENDTPKPNEEVPAESLSSAQAILNLVNTERSKNGAGPLTLNTALNTAAYRHSEDMRVQNYFDHTGKNGSTFSQRAKKAGYLGFAQGENIAQGSRTPKGVFDLWMNSKGHRENILNPSHTEMGLGKSGTLWTQIFGVSK